MHAEITQQTPSIPEVMLMLRAPGAGWLATLLAALDQATRDPDFSPNHRAILARCLDESVVPMALVDAARKRTAEFEQLRQTGTELARRVPDRVTA